MPGPAVSRCSHVGSWLRPQSVKDARAAFAKGEINEQKLRELTDPAIAEVVEQQRKAGLKEISDGEFRRDYFHLDFLSQLGGITVVKNDLTSSNKDDYKPPSLAVTGKITHDKPIEVENFKYLQSLIDPSKGEVVKIAIPSPTMAHFRGGRASIDIKAYPNLDDFFEDLAAAYRAEIKALSEAGCTFVQLDDTNLAYLCDLKMREAAAGRGEDLNVLPRQYASLINAAVKDAPENMTIAIHLCRGNFRSTHFAEGGYEPVAEVLFNELNANVYYLEFDDDRSGNFEPLRFLPKGKTVVLGLVSSKVPELEDKAKVVKRVEEAGTYAPINQLAVSAQCGFASTHHGNNLTVEEQWKKVALLQDIAKSVNWDA
ncbi:UROD/MetE-like protein [Cystobasidium minutum MCA 4210]|uniref:UROD/MetE-like protein n=1 Tax=Cystobasidium minutum MCA 4210 TaxID=1397322 RepID=UPI0034CD2461|eukprot:jgi/Rhomi1/140782/e_gw1.2.502.1